MHLTPTESKVYNLVLQGKSNREIGRELNVNERTIETHMRNMLVKLKYKNRIELLVKELQK